MRTAIVSPDWRLFWEMKNEHFINLGTRILGGYEFPFGLFGADRRKHCYVLGKSGSGKSTLLFNMMVQDIEAGEGVGFFDPHGQDAEKLLDYIPPHRANDVIYFNPSDAEFPVGLNLLRSEDSKPLLASAIVGAFKGVWRESWGPRLEYILYATVAALSECENMSILGIQRMLTDEGYRDWVVKQVEDPMVRSFWVNEFAAYDRKFIQEAVSPILNKAGQLSMSPLLRNVLGQVGTQIDARFIMDNRKIFIANLSKGRLGADKSALLGSLLTTQFQLAAMARADIPEDQRADFFLFIDEFSNFATDAFVGILSEARKFRLCLTLSNQYVGLLQPEVRDALFGNVGSLIAFAVGHSDAEVLERQFGGAYSAAHLTELSNYEICARMPANGESGVAFTGKMLAPLGHRHGLGKRIIQRSRKRYGTKREIVEERINRAASSY